MVLARRTWNTTRAFDEVRLEPSLERFLRHAENGFAALGEAVATGGIRKLDLGTGASLREKRYILHLTPPPKGAIGVAT